MRIVPWAGNNQILLQHGMCDYTHMSNSNPVNYSNNTDLKNPYTLLGELPIARDKCLSYKIDEHDLDEHFYCIGRSGTGKSNLLIRLALADIARGSGHCFIDPIGATAEAFLSHLPDAIENASSRQPNNCRAMSRTSNKLQKTHEGRDASGSRETVRQNRSCKDIIYIDCSDTEFPIGINPLYNIAPEDQSKAVSDILQLFSFIWHDTGWGPRMESIFRAALHTLIENPQCSRPSLLSIFHLLLDTEYRANIKKDLTNKQVLEWWDLRFDRGDLNDRTKREWVEPILNKIDTMSLDPLIRNIIGQPRCKLDFDEIIRKQQVLVINLNQNKIGSDNAAFIGMLIIARIRQAANKHSANATNEDKHFTLTLDEAHSFPTMELTQIINQGRHSNLYARIAHQNLEQFDPKIASTLRNGCGSIAVFAVGQRDAQILANDLSRTSHDQFLRLLTHLNNGEAILRLSQAGTPRPANTTPVQITYQEKGSGTADAFKRFTRERFGTSKLKAEFQIETAHQPISREDYLIWKSRFDQEKQKRRKEWRIQTRAKKALKNAKNQALGTQIPLDQQLSKELNLHTL